MSTSLSSAPLVGGSSPQAAPKDIGDARPLVMRCGAFGDIVLLTALIRQLHARFGKPVDVIASGPWTRPLLEGQTGVGEIVLVRRRGLPSFLVPEQRQLIRWLRQRGPGPAWFGDLRAGIDLLKAGGIPEGYICDSRNYQWPRHEHFVERWVRFANLTPPALEGRLPPPVPPIVSSAVLEIEPAAREALRPWLAERGIDERPYIVLQIGNRRTFRRWLPQTRKVLEKYWPEDRWVEVIRFLRRQCPDHAIVLSGTMTESDLNERIKAWSAAADVHNVCGAAGIPILLPLLERAVGMISVDTGPSHAAAALGCPTVSLFGGANEILYRPGGPHTPAVTLLGYSADPKRQGQRDIAGISVDAVFKAWDSLEDVRQRRRAALVKDFRQSGASGL